jgi:phosphoadenosine phosphosulfate reductase
MPPNIRVFTLDTGRLPPETFELVEDVRQRYGIIVESWLPDRRAARPAVTQPEARR